ncbi:hypothetical protein ON010_g6262 [Phytophthora cinnamomi]|nr:hypothetical protein ON010_g6262 [Phytophthora cinnamomi]
MPVNELLAHLHHGRSVSQAHEAAGVPPQQEVAQLPAARQRAAHPEPAFLLDVLIGKVHAHEVGRSLRGPELEVGLERVPIDAVIPVRRRAFRQPGLAHGVGALVVTWRAGPRLLRVAVHGRERRSHACGS